MMQNIVGFGGVSTGFSSGNSYKVSPSCCYVSSSFEYLMHAPCNCILCTQGKPPCLCVQDPSWTTIVSVILYVLHHHNPDRPYFPLKSYVYPYVVSHWSELVLPNKNTQRWKKQILDALSHGTRLFATGQQAFLKNGYWGLKCRIDPWNPIDEEKPHSSSTYFPTQSSGVEAPVVRWKASRQKEARTRTYPYKQAYHHAAHVHHQHVLQDLFPCCEAPTTSKEATEDRILPPIGELMKRYPSCKLPSLYNVNL